MRQVRAATAGAKTRPKTLARPKTLLQKSSPYGSCQLIVEADAAVTAAYLLDDESRVRSRLWLANHVPAPRHLDQERIEAGLLPPMPAGHTKHREGRVRLRRRSLETVWFPAGDAVALLEDGAPVGVIPGWAYDGRPVPSFSCDAIGRTPLGWALDAADSDLHRHIAGARDFWRWQASRDGWGEYQRAVLGYLEQQLGPGERYWGVDDGRLPRLGMVEHPETANRPFAVYSTVGMSCQRMPPSGWSEPPTAQRTELALAIDRPYEFAVDLFSWLASYPWRWRTRFESSHWLAWDAAGGGFQLGGPWEGVLMLDAPRDLLGPAVPDLSGLTADGHAIRWLWVLPITREQCGTAAEHGPGVLLDELRIRGHRWVTHR